MNLLATLVVSLFCSAFGEKREEANIILFPPSFVRPSDSVVSDVSDERFVLRLRGVIYQYEAKRATVDYQNGGEVTFTPNRVSRKAGDLFAYRTSQLFTETPGKRKFDLFISVSAQQQLRTATGTDAKFGDVVVVSPDESSTNYVKLSVTIDESGGFMVEVPTKIGQNFEGDSKSNQLLIDSANIRSALTDAGNSPVYWVQARIHSEIRHDFFIATETLANIIGLHNNELQIVSDVDDTVKISGVNQGLHKMLKAGLFTEYSAVPGMPDLFRYIVKQRADANMGTTGFHFLSASPWALLKSYVNDFFMANGFPWASVTSRVNFPRGHREALKMATAKPSSESTLRGESGEYDHMKFVPEKSIMEGTESLIADIEKRKKAGAYEYKKDRIDEMIKGPSWNQIMFFGDSTESDSEAAQYLVHEHRFIDHHDGGKVVCIFLHFVASSSADDDEKKGLEYENYLTRVKYEFHARSFSRTNPLDRVRVFKDPQELMDVDFANGRCHSKNSRLQWNK